MLPDQDTCWNAVVHRDRALDGQFLYGVLTTGVFCRPSCGARQPLRRNVRFYASAQAAAQDGLRPCRRCKPLETAPAQETQNQMTEIAAYIRSHASEPLSLNALATRAGMSRFHFQRTFRQIIGVTPKQLATACRLAAVKVDLRHGASVTSALYDAGFGSSSRLYEKADAHLGLKPAEYRAGAPGVAISWASMETPLGLLMVAATARGLCFVQFGESIAALTAALHAEFPAADISPLAHPYPPAFARWTEALLSSLAGSPAVLDLPLDIRATAFQARVWSYLRQIPRGSTQSYSEVAAALGAPRSTRAVARACATNPVALVIPCHRVIRGDGSLAGYRWGLQRKSRLIEQEAKASCE